MAGRLGMEPPGLVQLEREVDLQIERYQCGLDQMTADLLLLRDDDDDGRVDVINSDDLNNHSAPNEPPPLTLPDDDRKADEPSNNDVMGLEQTAVEHIPPVAHLNRSVSSSSSSLLCRLLSLAGG